ncbi:MAG: tRNA epoxyqueuosine(34) reductase QueG [Pseudomonadales bacterium]|nr:tRNA epoxyqueuosine(34) reductase QueG [Pseudomonadales bacterium]
MSEAAFQALTSSLSRKAKALGFQQLSITDAEPGKHKAHLQNWLADNYHGEMLWMQDRADMRMQPDLLHKGTVRVISVRMDYLTDNQAEQVLAQPQKAYISRYALGRDYHKLMRKKLARLAAYLADLYEQYADSMFLNKPGSRPFVDSAPVLERAFAEKAGLGWIGKNTMLIHPKAGSWFFLGEIYTSLPLPITVIAADSNSPDIPVGNHCGSCRNCLDACPTGAFVNANQLDARKCISYLTIELEGSIPENLRQKMGNRVFGCDDCQLVCPFNKFAATSAEPDFSPRHQLDDTTLLELFLWNEKSFLQNTAGSPIRRIGDQRWSRNLAIGLGNAPYCKETIAALRNKLPETGTMAAEHIQWAIDQQRQKQTDPVA